MKPRRGLRWGTILGPIVGAAGDTTWYKEPVVPPTVPCVTAALLGFGGGRLTPLPGSGVGELWRTTVGGPATLWRARVASSRCNVR